MKDTDTGPGAPTESSPRKQAAVSFLRLAASGHAREAFHTYAGPGFRHHNPYFRGDAETLMRAMDENAQANPHKLFEVERALEDGDLVAVHGRVRHKPNDPDYALVHIFRFEGDRVVELWDVGQEVPRARPTSMECSDSPSTPAAITVSAIGGVPQRPPVFRRALCQDRGEPRRGRRMLGVSRYGLQEMIERLGVG